MKRIALLMTVFVEPVFANAQNNLMPNPGFELYTSCPNGQGQIYKALSWTDPTNASSDYYHTCGTTSDCSVPNNLEGTQTPKSGNAYAGLVTYAESFTDRREYIQTSLSDSLINGKKYCVSFYVSNPENVKYASDGIGAYFSKVPVSCVACFLPFTAQVSNSPGNILSDTVNWQQVSGSFIANGGEKYMTIGNFRNDLNTVKSIVNGSAFYVVSYLYIDDVSVVEVANANAGSNKTICLKDSVQLGTTPVTEVSYTWSPAAGLSNPNISNPKASPSATTTYTLTQRQCNMNTSATVTITVNDCDSIDIFIPTAFSPNDDGNNDILFVRCNKIVQALDFAVYDRWGELVFQTHDITRGWDGIFNEKRLSDGIFIYYAKVILQNGKEIFKKGDVALVR